MSVCQIPGCPRDATYPPGVGQVCTACRTRVGSKCFFSPLLFWGMLWLMAKELHDLLMEKSIEAGEVEVEYREYVSAEGLLRKLTHGGGLSEFLSWVASEIGVEHLPEKEVAWLNRFATRLRPKSQRRVLTTYWRMLCPDMTSRTSWIILIQEDWTFRATANAGLRDVEKVLHFLEPHPKGTWVLRTPWTILFPPKLGITG